MCDAARSRNPGAVITCAVLASCGGATPSGTRDAQADLHADVAPAELSDPRAAICATASAAGVTAAPPFDVVQQIFDTNCVYCHSQGADVDLSAAVAWGNLVGRPAPPIAISPLNHGRISCEHFKLICGSMPRVARPANEHASPRGVGTRASSTG